jgi:predicted peroxiredoxin
VKLRSGSYRKDKGEKVWQRKSFKFIITHSFARPDLVAGARQLATNMKAFDTELDFFLIDNGVLLAKEGFAETLIWQKKDEFSPVHELMKTLIEDFSVKFYICASCVKHYELDKAKLIKNSEVKPGSYLGEMLLEREGLTF